MTDAPEHKMVDGALVPMTPEDIAQWQEDQSRPRRPAPVLRDANVRIDTAMEMLTENLPAVPDEATVRRMDESQLADHVAELSAAMRAMLIGFKGRQPRDAAGLYLQEPSPPEPPPEPEPEPEHAKRKPKRR